MHVSKEMSLAYRLLKKYFTTDILNKLNEHAKKVYLYGGFDEESEVTDAKEE